MSEIQDGICVECVNECCPGMNKSIITTDVCHTCIDDDDYECVRCLVGYAFNSGFCELCESNECCPGNTITQLNVSGCMECDSTGMRCVSCEEGMKVEKRSGGCVLNVGKGNVVG